MKERTRGLVLFIVIMALLYTTAFAAPGETPESDKLWTDYAATEFDGGDGSASNPYKIANAQQFAKLAKDVNINYDKTLYSGQYFVLTSDIDLDGHLWDPIGRHQNQSFAANFDGQNHVVKNMTVKASVVPQYEYSGQLRESGALGLFGHISSSYGSTICDLGLVNAKVEIDQRKTLIEAGLLTGVCAPYPKNMTNCFAEGEIIATVELTVDDKLGGLMGYGSNVNLENCYFTGMISQPTSVAKLGGLVGYIYTGKYDLSTVQHCYTAATFSPKGAGLCYKEGKYLTIKGNYFDNSDGTNATSSIGTGLSGGNLKTLHMAGVLNHNTGDRVWAHSPNLNSGYPVLNKFHPELTGTTPTEIILRKGGSEEESTADTILTAKGMAEKKRYLAHVLDQNGRILPGAAVTWTVEGSDTVTVDESGLVIISTDAPNHTCTVRATSVDVPSVTNTFPLTVQHRDTVFWTDNVEPDPDCNYSGGSGTQENPYCIDTVQDLAQLAVNSKVYDTYGIFFRLTRNLDLSEKFWDPIGQTDRKLEGVFDGNGHVISGLRLRSSLLPVKDNRQYLGLFGCCALSVKNIGMEGAVMELDQACGEIHAGVLGGNLTSASNCYVNNATITISEACKDSKLQIGGLGCYLSWDMTSCWFRGTIDDQSGKSDTSIGVLDYTNSNYSEVRNSWSDALIKTKSTDICNKGSFYTVDGLPQGSYDPSSGKIRTREQLKSVWTAVSLNEQVEEGKNPWIRQDTINDGYPQLAVFCKVPDPPVASHVQILKGGYVVTEDTIVTRQCENAIRTDLKAHVADQYGRPISEASSVWSVEPSGAGVNVDATTGAVAVEPETAAGDYVITAVSGTGTDSVVLHVIRPDKNLWSDGLTYNPDCTYSGGDGTAASPYLISSEQDLAQLAVNVNAGTVYSGQFLRLTTDLNLAGKYWVPIGGRSYRGGNNNEYRSDRIHSFRGSFDGGFHTISNMELLYDVLWDRLGEDYRQSFNYVGLFGILYSNDGSIINLALQNASAAVYDWGCGFYAQGIKQDKKEQTGVGLLIGLVHGGFNDQVYVDSCYAQGSINVGAYARGVGGLAGISKGGIIRNTFFRGSITQGVGYTAGGIAGAASNNGNGSLSHSFSAASIDSRATVYGVYSYSADTCIYDSTLLPAETIRSTRFEKCHERTMKTEELKSRDGLLYLCCKGTFDGSETNAWGWDGQENDGYPYLLGFAIVKPVLWTDGITADAGTSFAGGTGTKEDPFKITTTEQLAMLSVNVNTGTVADGYQGKFFALDADLDLTGKYWVPIGLNDQNFKGAFDGGLHTISGMTIKATAVPDFRRVGLFGYVKPSSFDGYGIWDVLMVGASVEVDRPGVTHLGTLIGSSFVPVSRCGVEGTINAHFDVTNLGGLVGWCNQDIRSSFFRGEIRAKGGDYHGGLLGNRYSGYEYNCYTSVVIISTARWGICPVSDSCTYSLYNKELYTDQVSTSAQYPMGMTSKELKSLRAAALLNGKDCTDWTSDGIDWPMLTRGKAPIANVPDVITVMEDTKLSDVDILNSTGNTEGNWLWMNPEKSVGNIAGEKTFEAIFLPKDSAFIPVRANIIINVKKAPILIIEDSIYTPELEVSIQNADEGWCTASAYRNGQMVSYGISRVQPGNSYIKIALSEYDAQGEHEIKAFLLNKNYVPQTEAQTK